VAFGEKEKGGYAFVPLHPRGRQRSLIWRGEATAQLAAALRDATKELEPRATAGARAFEPFERTFGEPRLLARVTGVLGLLALTLTIAGVYSVTSHTVGGRTSEIGVRMALGATAMRVRRMILREALRPAVVGVGVGLAAAFWWAQTIKALLFGIDARNPWAFAASAVLVLCVVALAGLIPATRASRINPVEALRAE
jgi:macrolide transport system ATP-binding/permease protein